MKDARSSAGKEPVIDTAALGNKKLVPEPSPTLRKEPTPLYPSPKRYGTMISPRSCTVLYSKVTSYRDCTTESFGKYTEYRVRVEGETVGLSTCCSGHLRLNWLRNGQYIDIFPVSNRDPVV